MDDELASYHSDFRLMQRAGEFDQSITEVWEASIPCEVKHRGYDEARVHPENGVVLLMEGSKIVTILYAEPEEVSIDEEHFQEYLRRSM